MLSHPQEELERVCQFIGYDQKPQWNFKLEAQNVSSERIRKSAWRDFLVETPGLRELRQLLIPKSVRTWVRSFWTMNKKPELTSNNYEKLRFIFDQDLAILGSQLGIELSCDNFKLKIKNQGLNWVKKT